VIRATATSNFHNFTGLLGSDCEHMGVLGDISNHYGVVESNGRGMLHLHALVWTKGNVEFAKIRDRVLNDSSRMISFL
jgi:Helitron helicase-like domain at N-terminus